MTQEPFAGASNRAAPEPQSTEPADNLGLLYKVARNIRRPKFVDEGDLINAGYLGLVQAQKHFKPELGWNFSSYAYRGIRFRMIEEMSLIINMFDIPRWILGQIPYRKAGKTAPYSSDTERRRKTLDHAIRMNESVTIRENSDRGDGQPFHLSDITDSPRQDEVERSDLIGRIVESIESLDDRERQVISHRYPLDGSTPKTLAETEKLIGLGRTRVLKIEAIALAKIRKSLNPFNFNEVN